MPSCTCPRCHRNIRGEPAGYCRWCDAFTGRCGASFLASVLLATGAVDLTGWPHPCTLHGTERWRVISGGGGDAGTLFCASHGDALRGGGASRMQGSGLRLVFVGARDGA
jgi:hypothetical protein